MTRIARFVSCLGLLLACALGAQSRKPLAIASYGAAEFDAATTYSVIHNCSSCRERDPLLKPFAGNPSIFVVMGASAWGMNRQAHGKWGKALEWTMIGAHIAAGIHNLRQ